MANKKSDLVGWVTIKGVHFPKWKDGTIGWQNGEEHNESKTTIKETKEVDKIKPTNLQVFKENSNQLTKALEEAKKQNALEMHYTDATGQTYTYYWDGAKFTRDKINQDMAKKYGKKSGVYETSFKKPENWSDEIAKSSTESKNSRYDIHKLEQDKKYGNDIELSGEVSFNDLMRATRDTNHIHFDKGVSYSLKGKNPPYGDNKKSDLVDRLNEYKVNDVVVDMYRDKSGANDLKRMQEAGFEIQAYYKGKNQGNIPARDYYYMKRKNTSTSGTVSRNSRYDTSKASGKIGGKITTRKQLDDETQKYRAQGYSIITFGNNRRELEKNGKIIVLEIKK